MITKIVSGGQTGADQAALDIAIKMGIPHGGWIPKGRLTESGSLSEEYNLKEMPTESYFKRTERNVIDSDGTVILSHGILTGGSKLTQELAFQHNKPCLHINLDVTPTFIASAEIITWADDNKIEVLNVAGSRASGDPKIYKETFYAIEGAIILGLIDIKHSKTVYDFSNEELLEKFPVPPKTVEEAVNILIDGMSLKDKVLIANMKNKDLLSLYQRTSKHLKNIFQLEYKNDELKRSCQAISQKPIDDTDDVATVIIDVLFKKLKETHRMRVVK